MAFSRRLGVVSILSACWLAAVGCDDAEDRNTSADDGGEGGEGAGGGGKSMAGSSNNAGKAGKGGANASGGEGGSGDAGLAGSGEGGGGTSAGEGGAAVIGGAAGEAGQAGGGNEAGGNGGDGGGGGAPEPQALTCAFECDSPDDCGAATCDEVTHRCVDPATVCQTNDDCAPFANSFFWLPCENTAGCTEGLEACVNWQNKGVGYCAALELDGCLAGVAKSAPELGGSGNVSVCVDPGICVEGACDFACDHSILGGCGSGRGDTCNPTSGLCECATGDECDSDVCGEDSHCVECVTSEHCPGGVSGEDTCVSGRCGCSSAEVCSSASYPTAVPRCE